MKLSRKFSLTLGMEYESMALIEFKTASTLAFQQPLCTAHAWKSWVPYTDTGIMCSELSMRTLLKTDNSIWMWQGIASKFDLISCSRVAKGVLVSIFLLSRLGNAKDQVKPQIQLRWYHNECQLSLPRKDCIFCTTSRVQNWTKLIN